MSGSAAPTWAADPPPIRKKADGGARGSAVRFLRFLEAFLGGSGVPPVPDADVGADHLAAALRRSGVDRLAPVEGDGDIRLHRPEIGRAHV